MTEVPPTQDTPPPPPSGISSITIEEEMRSSYLDYAMSVIVSRALPDVRDGLKPVHRRILYAMKENGYDWNKGFRKSARVVGDVMGKYHPHGDAAIYDAMVRMAQDFSMRLPLIDGQGNFGSMDGDPPAAMRYTEARLARAAHELLEDIDKETVDFQENYDSTTSEPVVLPAQFPNLLANGAGGIAVGMATNIPPHNLGELIDACCVLLDDPAADIDRLMECIPGPDFPTGGIIFGATGIKSAYHNGRGSVVMRGRTAFEDIGRDRQAIIVSEVPYQVNKARMIEQIAEAVRDKRIEGISELRDESDRDGVRVVVELKRDAMAEVVLNQLYRYTPLQSSFGVNMLALNGGRPEMMNLKQILEAFIAFREEVITRRTIYELGKARDRAHVLAGLAVAVANLDDVIRLIRAAKDPQVAREQLMAKAWPARDVAPLIELIDEPGRKVDEDGNYNLSETQARAILELRLHRLTGLERDKIAEELKQVCEQIKEYLEILVSREKLRAILREEILHVKEQFATPRRTELVENDAEFDIEDLIQREDMVVTVSHNGYIKRVPLSAYRAQRRGGKGRSGMSIRDEDFVSQVFVVNTHTPVLFFSSRGQVYKEKVYRLPLGTPQARGKALVNLLPLEQGETITTLMPLPEDESTWEGLNILFATRQGYVRPISLSEYKNIYSRGLIAIKLQDGDQLVGVKSFAKGEDALLATRNGKCIRFALEDLRLYGSRNTVGVRGIRLIGDDEVISMSLLRHVDFTVEERDAYMRRSRAERADSDENGEGAGNGNGADAGFELDDVRYAEMQGAEQFILTVTARGFGKRTSAYEYRITGRGGQGVGNIDLGRNGGNAVVGSFPVEPSDQIMLVTDAGKLIRTMVRDIRIAGRSTRGVTLFRVADDEHVVSVAHLAEPDEDDATEAEDEEAAAIAGSPESDESGDGQDDD